MSEADDGYITIEGRRYPEAYAPGTHWATDEGWRLLDHIKEGAIPHEVRLFLCGAIAGAVMRAHDAGKREALSHEA